MTTSQRLRLFVAAPVPESHLARVHEVTAGLRARWPRARWMEPANQHVTLKFLGATDVDALDDVTAAVAGAVRRHEPAPVRLSALGVFPGPRRARVLWVGLDDPRDLLGSLAADLAAAFEPLGYEREKREFRPHLTLARFREPVRMANDLADLALDDLAPFSVAEIGLFRSHLHPRGARYEELQRFPLGRSTAQQLEGQ